MIMAPPSKVDILSHDVAYIPHLKNYILLLAEGKTDNRDYSLSKLWVYNWEKEKFTDTLDLGVKAAEIAVNDKFLFVYSSDINKIYKILWGVLILVAGLNVWLLYGKINLQQSLNRLQSQKIQKAELSMISEAVRFTDTGSFLGKPLQLVALFTDYGCTRCAVS